MLSPPQFFYTQLLLLSTIVVSAVIGIRWEHSVDLNDDYRVLWTISKMPSVSQQQMLLHTQHQSYFSHLTEITFEIQVKTLGYIGFGFSPDGQRSGSDIVIGWVDHGQTYFHDRHIKKNGDSEPFVDPSQDYILLLGYENATHTVMRFKRKLDTCDTSHDIPITNDTMRVIYMYHSMDPLHGSVVPGSLPNPRAAFKGYKPLSITQRQPQDETLSSVSLGSLLASSLSSTATAQKSTLSSQPSASNNAKKIGSSSSSSASAYSNKLHIFELLNEDVKLPAMETLFWCKVFEFQQFNQKQHLVKFEPVFDSKRSKNILQHIILYECQESTERLAAMARENGQMCYGRPSLPCNSIVAAWFKGSESFTFPPDVGYALHSRFYLMETHYSDMEPPKDLESLHTTPAGDNSGLRLYYTSALRKHDAGVLSVGIDPSWRHIIPPLQQKVISEGHCTDDCTKKSFPPQGISIFAVIMQTHNIGKEVKLRQIRKREELLPIVIDRNVHAGYSEYRRLSPPVRVYPGDRLIAECTYNSSQRTAITLGGLTTREESCKAFAVYYPKQHKLTTCHSLPSLPTVLHSLGISELAMDSNPVLILKPAELAGMSLENRLTSYDWQSQFDVFQRVTRNGSFRPICLDAKNNMLPGTESIERYSPVLTKYWQQAAGTCAHFQHNFKIGEIPNVIDTRKNYMAAAGGVGDSEAESMSLSGSRTINTPLTNLLLYITALSIMVFAT